MSLSFFPFKSENGYGRIKENVRCNMLANSMLNIAEKNFNNASIDYKYQTKTIFAFFLRKIYCCFRVKTFYRGIYAELYAERTQKLAKSLNILFFYQNRQN